MENLDSIIGQNLIALRKAKGLTQQDVAAKLNYSDKSISKWELGYSSPAIDVLKDLADFYGVTVDYLLRVNTYEDAQRVVSPNKNKGANKAIILALTNTIVWLIVICIFLSEYFISDGTVFNWSLFMWGVPSCFIASAFLCLLFYGRNKTFWILFSFFMWTLIICFWLQYWLFNTPSENIWYILTVCVPLQIIVILGSHIKRNGPVR